MIPCMVRDMSGARVLRDMGVAQVLRDMGVARVLRDMGVARVLRDMVWHESLDLWGVARVMGRGKSYGA